MKSGRRMWKSYAKQALKGRYGLPMMAMLLVTGAQFLGSYLAGMFFPGTDILSQILSQVFLFIVTLLICVLSAGMYYMYLKMSRDQAHSLKDLIYYFRNEPDRIIIASFVLALLTWVTSLPSELFVYLIPMGNTLEAVTLWTTGYSILLIIGLVVNLMISIPFTLTYYLLADDESLEGIDALKLSMSYMHGYKLKYFLLQLSFVPLIILSIFTFYIALLWIIPYMEMANVMFYRDIMGEFYISEE